MRGLVLAVILFASASCSTPELRFERFDGSNATLTTMKLLSMEGLRDGDAVKAEAVFVAGPDSARMSMVLHLGPPARFMSGTYRATFAGTEVQGSVECPSLTFLGGQANLPSIGGVFVFKDAQGKPIYRITMPPTPIARRTVIIPNGT